MRGQQKRGIAASLDGWNALGVGALLRVGSANTHGANTHAHKYNVVRVLACLLVQDIYGIEST